jgi:hypothetical protein
MSDNIFVAFIGFIISLMVTAIGSALIIPDSNNKPGIVTGSIIGTSVVIGGIIYGALNYLYPTGLSLFGGGDYSSESSSSI